MRPMLAAVVMVLALNTLSTHADTDTKTRKVERLVEAQGLLDSWKQQMESGEAAAAAQGQQVLDQVLSNLNPNEEFRARFEAAFNAFLEQTSSPWTAEHLVEVYASYYGPHFTEDELDRLIAFYTSDLGRKDVRSTHSAIMEWSNHFQGRGQKILQDALQAYIDRMKLIAKECSCGR